MWVYMHPVPILVYPLKCDVYLVQEPTSMTLHAVTENCEVPLVLRFSYVSTSVTILNHKHAPSTQTTWDATGCKVM